MWLRYFVLSHGSDPCVTTWQGVLHDLKKTRLSVYTGNFLNARGSHKIHYFSCLCALHFCSEIPGHHKPQITCSFFTTGLSIRNLLANGRGVQKACFRWSEVNTLCLLLQGFTQRPVGSFAKVHLLPWLDRDNKCHGGRQTEHWNQTPSHTTVTTLLLAGSSVMTMHSPGRCNLKWRTKTK